jgi:HlyD family secretion protein
MSATVDIQTKKADHVITVPIQAVTTRADSSAYLADQKMKGGEEAEQDGIVIKDSKDKSNDESKNQMIKVEECVFLYKDGKACLVKVKTGIQDNNFIEVTEGVKEGDEVIAAPYSAIAKQLKDGLNVNKVDKSELFNTNKK